MRALSSGIPRGFKDSRTPEARRYRLYCLAVLRRLGNLPADGLVTLRECGRITVELDRLALDLEAARGRQRRRDANRIRRQQVSLRVQLARLEERLERFASTRSPESAADWAARNTRTP